MRPKLCVVTLVLTFFVIYGQAIQYKVTDQVYLDIEQNDQRLGRIVLGLFGEITPITVKNFVTIAGKGVDGNTYAGSKFHRVIPKFMIQGGDILTNNGSGSTSIYGKYFDDENFDIKHNGPGFISMANAGKNTNGCQFFITTIPTPWLDGHHTVFGKVVEGQDIVHKIEQMKTDSDDHPVDEVLIKESGVINTPMPFFVSDEHYE